MLFLKLEKLIIFVILFKPLDFIIVYENQLTQPKNPIKRIYNSGKYKILKILSTFGTSANAKRHILQ